MTLHITYPIVPPAHDVERIAQARAMRNLAVMFADIADVAGIYASLGEVRAHHVIAATAQLMTDAAQACGGRIAKPVGDTLLCTYSSVDDGARGAIAIQQALMGLQGPDAERVAVRVGFNYGPVVEIGSDIYGDSVNVASRLVQIARPNQILTTASCVEQLAPPHRSKAQELQLIGVRGGDSFVPVWEMRWRDEEPAAQRAFSAARQAPSVSPLKIEFRGRGWELWREGDVLTVGRDETNDLHLEGRRASRNHARIMVRKGKFILIDHSTNGTYVLPEGGDTVAMMHEEFALGGSGAISFGCIAASAGDELLRYARGGLALPRATACQDQVPAQRAGITRTTTPRYTR